MIIARFAPSPTGDPHIGNIRSALFSYLFAKKNGGEFLLRIEDTDQKRHVEESIQTIKDALKWLKILPKNLDNPMIQSKRLPIYKKAALKLVREGKAYVCDCSKERLKEVRETQKAKGRPPGYDGHCRDKKLEFKSGCVIRMKVLEKGKIVVNDLVRGRVEFDLSTIDDQVILKSDGFPTYHLAHVVDDAEMGITHVIRAEEWLPSTPKHILLNQMLGYKIPEYAHLPVILGANRGKLSKRDGATGIMEYKKLGYLPEALINFMVLLGWNPKTPRPLGKLGINLARGKPEEEFFTLQQLEEIFDLKNVNKAAAIFDIQKLNHFNRHYLQKKPALELIPLLDKKILAKLPKENLEKAVKLAQQRMTTLNDFGKIIDYLVSEPKIDRGQLIFKKSTAENTKKALGIAAAALEKIAKWEKSEILAALEKVVSQNKLSNGDVFWSVRFALSGLEKSPPPEEIAEILGKEKTIKRIETALAKL